jgi:hypothetical protein
MIPNENWEEIGNFIRYHPSAFLSSAVIGIYNGDNMCASLMHNSKNLKNITLYENFEDMDIDQIPYFKRIYQSWKLNLRNLTIKYVDGYVDVLDTNFDFISFDGYINTYKFILKNLENFKTTLFACTDYGKNLDSTIYISKLLEKNIIYPVLHTRCVLFFTVDLKKHHELLDTINAYSKVCNEEYILKKFNKNNFYVINSFYHKKQGHA